MLLLLVKVLLLLLTPRQIEQSPDTCSTAAVTRLDKLLGVSSAITAVAFKVATAGAAAGLCQCVCCSLLCHASLAQQLQQLLREALPAATHRGQSSSGNRF